MAVVHLVITLVAKRQSARVGEFQFLVVLRGCLNHDVVATIHMLHGDFAILKQLVLNAVLIAHLLLVIYSKS